jgi:predicted dehydrogenase
VQRVGQRDGDESRVDKAAGVLGAAHRAQLADFAAAITNGTPVRVSTTAARTSLSVILAMYESAATGQPVKL